MEKLLTVQECADLLHLSKPTIYRLVKEEGLPWVRPTGADMRFRPEQVEAWLESRGAVASA
jgi:excisionase family DNA binding protein